MEGLKIAICDTNREELDGYAKICQTICDTNEISAVFHTFSSSKSFMFEMSDPVYSSKINIVVIEPDGCDTLAADLRAAEYDGIIMYLSRSVEAKHFFGAFDAKVYNYVEKGDYMRFKNVFESALKICEKLDRQYIAVSCAGEYRQIDIRDIYYFETTMDHMVCVWYAGGNFVFPSSLSDLEERLLERGFFRIHRSYLVSVHAVDRVSFDRIILNNGKSIPVSRGNYQALKTALDTYR